MEEQFNKEAKQRMEICSRRSKDYRRKCKQWSNASTCREEFLWQSIANLEQFSAKKKGGNVDSSKQRKNCSSMGECHRRYTGFCSTFLALRGLDTEKKSLDGK